MVPTEITDGSRIAALLASELAGLAVGALADLSVVDADPDGEPSSAATGVYGIAFEGERLGEVGVRPTEAVVTLDRDWPPADVPDGAGLRVEAAGLVVTRGAAVKRAADRIQDTLAGEQPA